MTYLDDLYAERFGKPRWWTTPKKTAEEEDAAWQRKALCRAAELAEEDEQTEGAA